MSTKAKTLGFAAALLLSLGVALVTSASADHHDDHDDDDAKIKVLIKPGSLISPDEAREKALAAKPGTVTDLDLERSWRGSYHYEVEIVDPELRQWEVHIDAKTGKVQSIEREWFD